MLGGSFAILRAGQETVDQSLIRIRRAIEEKRLDFRRRRRQAGEIQGQPADECARLGLGSRLQPRLCQPSQYKLVEGLARPRRIVDGWWRHCSKRPKCPVLLEVRSLCDPPPQLFDLRRTQAVS